VVVACRSPHNIILVFVLDQMSFPGKAVQRCWHLVDASSQTVGRLAAQVAPILKGKHKPTDRPNGDCGDHVVIINAEQEGQLHG
jgi:ribosomal protein L13